MIHLESLLQMTLASEPGHYLKIRLINSFSRNPVSLSSWLSSKSKEYWPFIPALVYHQGDIAL